MRGRLGHGGQGVVYLGAGADGELVAVKWLRPDLSGDQVVMERFLREAATAQRVAAFCTARVLAMGIEQDRPYIVSEYVDGPSLQAVVAEEGPRDGVALHRLAIGTATALAAIHQAGIVHRDFKPANVLLARDGPRVIDFGISRALDATSTLSSAPVGTPAYMAPEQFLGQKAGPAADMFAWAGTMIYAATGKAAFGSDSLPAVLNRVLNGEPEHLSRLDGRLRELVEACLAKDPDERPTAEEVILGLLRHEVPGPRVLLEGAAAAGTSSRVGEDHTSADDGGPAGGGDLAGEVTADVRSVASVPGDAGAGRGRRRVVPLAGGGVLAAVLAVVLVVALVNRGDGGGARAGADATPSAVAAVPTGGLTMRPLAGEGDVVLYEHPGDPIILTAYRVWDSGEKELVPYARTGLYDGGFEKHASYLDAVTSPSGDLLARVPKNYDKDGYDGVEIVDRDVYGDKVTTIKTVRKPLVSEIEGWSRDSSRLLLSISEEISEGNWVNRGYAIVTVGDTDARVVRIDESRVRFTGYNWGGRATGADQVVTTLESVEGGTLRFYSPSGELVRDLPGVGDIELDTDPFSPSGSRFVTTCPDGPPYLLCLWDSRSGAQVRRVQTDCAHILGWYDENHLYCWAATKEDGMSVVQVVDLSGRNVRRLLTADDRTSVEPVFSRKPSY
ncbi:hypothetical protein GCM10023259_096360 [Thermocatellispora tengchongensis]